MNTIALDEVSSHDHGWAEAVSRDVFVACVLPNLAQEPFARRFASRFNGLGRTLTEPELLAASGSAAGLVVTATDPLRAPTIAALPSSVRVISTYSVGHDHIDLQAARARGIAVLSTPDVLSDSCADAAILLMLGAGRRVGEGLDLVRGGGWTGWTPCQLLGTDLYGSRLGIVGMGRIGRAVAQRARGFDMAVHYHNRTALPDGQAGDARFHATLAGMLPHCDFLCVACPSSPETRGMIGAEAIGLLPDGAIVTNISRGDVVDDRALVAALRSGKVAAAGLDVFANEPDIDPAYRTLPNVFALPHTGSATMRTRVAMARLLADGMEAVFDGRQAANRLV